MLVVSSSTPISPADGGLRRHAIQNAVEYQVAELARVVRRLDVPSHRRLQVVASGHGFHGNAVEAAEIPQRKRLGSRVHARFFGEGRDQRALPGFEERPPADPPVRLEVTRVHRRNEQPQVDAFFARERDELAECPHRGRAPRIRIPLTAGAPARKQLREPRMKVSEFSDLKYEPLAFELAQRWFLALRPVAAARLRSRRARARTG